MKTPLTFRRLRQTNLRRCRRWHPIESWTLSDWAMATAGELGEACNALKKIKRFDDKMQQKGVAVSREVLVRLAKLEIGDTLIYLDLLAARLGVTLEACAVETFNRVSMREDFPERL